MKQMQKDEYKLAKKIDLEIRQLSDQEAPLTPGKQKRHSLNIILHTPIDYDLNDTCMRLGIEVHVFDDCRQTCCDDKSVTCECQQKLCCILIMTNYLIAINCTLM